MRLLIPAALMLVSQAGIGDQNPPDQSATLANLEYQESLQELMPFDPDQIEEIKSRFRQTDRAIRYGNPPKLVSGSRNIALKPGASVEKLVLAPGYASSIIVVDSTGEPWPISSSVVGSPKWFSVVKPEGLEPGNLLTVQPLVEHANSNVIITLQGYDLPVAIQLFVDSTAGEKKDAQIDSIVTLQIDRIGPNAATPIIGSATDSPVNDALTDFLNGTPPSSATELDLDTDVARIWRYQGNLYVTSRHYLQWPNSILQGSLHGLRAYEIPYEPSIIFSVNGFQKIVDVEAGK